MPHRPEGGAVDVEVGEALGGIVLGQADGADLRLREDGGRRSCRGRAGRVVLERGLDEAHRLVDRDRRQLHPVGDVADRPDVVDVGARIVVDHDRAGLAGLDAGRFQAQIFGVGDAADRQHDLVDRQHLAAADRCASSRPSARFSIRSKT